MKARILIPLALIGLLSIGSAYAMTSTQAEQLSRSAYKGSAMDLAKLKYAAKTGDSVAQTWLGTYWY